MAERAACNIEWIETAVPERSLRTAEAPAVLERTAISRKGAKLLQRLAPHTGVERRHLAILDYQSTLDEQAALYRAARDQPHGPGMGARSAAFDVASDRLLRQLLARLPQEVLDGIDTLVTVSCTHASSPGLERTLFAHAPLPHSVSRWNLGFMGCSAALAAMRLVHAARDRRPRALVVACELSSLHFQYTDEIDQMTANLLFADGAAAMVLSPWRSTLRVVDCRCAALPQFADQMVWRAGDHGLALQLARELPETLGTHLPAVVDGMLAANGLRIHDVAHWLVHPGGPQILDAVESSLRLSDRALDLSRRILRDYGNMSSPTILFILKEHLKTARAGATMALAFGPGLTVELALLSAE